jgi:uncharacterized protein YggE
MMQIFEKNKKYVLILVSVFLIILSVYFVFKSISEFKNYSVMNSQVMNTVTLSGHGEVSAVPDLATISFSIRKEAKTVKEAQDQVATIEQKVLGFLKISGVADKDIKTADASFYPKYEYQTATSTTMCTKFSCPPVTSKSVIIGYEASESITVKIRKIDDVGKIMQGIGALEVSELNGPNFTIDNEDGLKADARKEAIDDARSKAKVLAHDLGVHLGKIVSFSENGNYPYPMYAEKAMLDSSMSAGSAAPAVIPAGENTISSDVSITFQIR